MVTVWDCCVAGEGSAIPGHRSLLLAAGPAEFHAVQGALQGWHPTLGSVPTPDDKHHDSPPVAQLPSFAALSNLLSRCTVADG